MVSPTRDHLFGLRATILKVLSTMAEVEAETADPLANLREMERSGELEPIPEVSAAMQ